jgi:hypothetical protein
LYPHPAQQQQQQQKDINENKQNWKYYFILCSQIASHKDLTLEISPGQRSSLPYARNLLRAMTAA